MRKQKMLISLLLPAIILLQYNIVTAQDSLQKNVKFSATVKLWIQQNNDLNVGVLMPKTIRENRQNSSSLPIDFSKATDNPLRHGASYLVVKTQTTLKQKVTLFTDVYAEHRGVSFGLFNRDNVVVYPVFYLQGIDSVKLLKKWMLFTGKVGMFLDEKLDEGLTVFNIDVQGYKLKVERAKWLLQYAVYGDFVNGIGLNIDDINSYSYTRKLGKNKSASLGVSLNNNIPLYESFLSSATVNLFGSRSLKNARAYFQIGLRPKNTNYTSFRINNTILQKAAINIGIENEFKKDKFRIKNVVEARYYGAIFNEDRYAYGLYYRKPAATEFDMYANTVGKFLYPLRKYNTPFSQWALYTEYRNSSIVALNWRGAAALQTSAKTEAYLDYDVNYIYAKNNEVANVGFRKLTSQFLYPFFTGGFNYKIVEGVKAGILFTNKAMNLDIQYPTNYLLSRPVFGLKVEADF